MLSYDEKRDLYRRLEMMLRVGVRWSKAFYRLWLAYDVAKKRNLAVCCREIRKGIEKDLKPEQYLRPWLQGSEIMLWEMGLSQGRPLLGFPVLWTRLEHQRTWLGEVWSYLMFERRYSTQDQKVLKGIYEHFKRPTMEWKCLMGHSESHWQILKSGDFERDVETWKLLSLRGLKEEWCVELADYVGMGVIREGFAYLCEREKINF